MHRGNKHVSAPVSVTVRVNRYAKAANAHVCQGASQYLRLLPVRYLGCDVQQKNNWQPVNRQSIIPMRSLPDADNP